MTVVGIWASPCGGAGCGIVGIGSAILCAGVAIEIDCNCNYGICSKFWACVLGECCL